MTSTDNKNFYTSEAFINSIREDGTAASADVRRRRALVREALASGSTTLSEASTWPFMKRERICPLIASLPCLDDSIARDMCLCYGVDPARCTLAAAGCRRLPAMAADADELSLLLSRGDYEAKRARALSSLAKGEIDIAHALSNRYLKREEVADILAAAPGIDGSAARDIAAACGIEPSTRACFLTREGRDVVQREIEAWRADA